jgi:hypothetical protein
MGFYKIVDNFLEAAAENILFGGGAATATPADIEISQNRMFKPLTWMKGKAGYVGGTNGNPFVVKNLLELKNAQRVLIDGNILENSWVGFSRVGFAIQRQRIRAVSARFARSRMKPSESSSACLTLFRLILCWNQAPLINFP